LQAEAAEVHAPVGTIAARGLERCLGSQANESLTSQLRDLLVLRKAAELVDGSDASGTSFARCERLILATRLR